MSAVRYDKQTKSKTTKTPITSDVIELQPRIALAFKVTGNAMLMLLSTKEIEMKHVRDSWPMESGVVQCVLWNYAYVRV